MGVATDGTVLTGQQPFRERRWALLALAQYRSGRQADALGSIRTARRTLGNELGLDPGSDLVALESAILAQDPTLAAVHEARLADDACPWKGLGFVRQRRPRHLLRPSGDSLGAALPQHQAVADFPLPAAAADVPHGDGSVLVAAGSSVALADPLTGKFSSAPFSRRGADSLQTSVLRVSADGSRAVQLLTTSTDPRCVERSAGVAGGCTAFIVYDLAERATIMGPLATPFRGADVAISRDGSLVAVAGGRRGEVATWDVRTGRLLAHSDGLATLPDLRGTEIGGATAAVAFGRGDLTLRRPGCGGAPRGVGAVYAGASYVARPGAHDKPSDPGHPR